MDKEYKVGDCLVCNDDDNYDIIRIIRESNNIYGINLENVKFYDVERYYIFLDKVLTYRIDTVNNYQIRDYYKPCDQKVFGKIDNLAKMCGTSAKNIINKLKE